MKHWLGSRTLVLIVLIILLCFGVSPAQQLGETVGVPWTGAPGVTESVSAIMTRELTRPLSPFTVYRLAGKEFDAHRSPASNPSAPAVSKWPAINNQKLNDVLAAPFTPQALGVNFLGANVSESGFLPPDCVGDVSPTQVVMVVNGRIKVFDKTGVLGGLNATTDNFFTSVGGVTNGTSDPHVRYDRNSGRWFVVIITVNTPNDILIAVSNSSTITNSSSFTFYKFTHDAVGTTPNTDTGGFADYPTLGVDANALYIGVNVFNAAGTSFLGTTGFVVRKSSILGGGPIVVTAFRQLGPASGTGLYTPQGVDNDDPSSTEGYFIGVDNAVYSLLQIRRVSTPGGTPSISGNLSVTVPTTIAPILQVVKGSNVNNRRLDALEDRLFAAHIRKNKITGVSSLWTAHNIEVDASGVATSGGGRNGSRWYQIGSMTTTPTLIQSGTLFDAAATNPRGFWIPSVAMSGQGHMALGCSFASVNDNAGVAVAGRFSSDVLGTIQSPTLAQTSSTAYNAQNTDGQRWGDFSQTVVDPADDQTLWTFQEYCDATDSWALRVIQLRAPVPATPTTPSPATAIQGASNINVTLTGTSSSGSGFYDPGTGYPNHISASVNGGGVTVNSVTFTDPTHATLNISIAAGATVGARTITVTNPDGQSTTSATGIFNITAGSCSTITLSPSSPLPSGAVGSAYNQTITASGGTAPYTYFVTGGSLPPGISLSSGGALAGTPTVGGPYSFTISASDSSGCPGSLAYTLNVTGCGTITLSPTSLPNGTTGAAYNQTISSSGGFGSYTYAVTVGSLPAGLLLSSSGVLSGTPTTAGTSNFTVTATDGGNSCAGNRAYSLTIDAVVVDITLSSLGTPYTQNFNTLASSGTSNTWTDNTTIPGWFASRTVYIASTGTSTSGGLYSFGASSNSERALGSLPVNAIGDIFYGARFVNQTGTTIASLLINYTGEQWRNGGNTTAQTLAFQYQVANAGVLTSISSGTWTSFSSLDFTSPIHTASAAALDGNSAANRTAISATLNVTVANGQEVWIRWKDINDSGNDHGLAVDDFSLTPNGVTPTNLLISGAANPSSINPGAATLLTGTVTPGTNPTGTGITVTGDLSLIGGSSTQQFYDDGTHGDVTPADNIFSYRDTIPPATTLGGKTLPLTVNDAQARSGSGSISLTITSCPAITLSPSTLPSGTTGTAYNQTISASGGTAPYTFAVITGTLPAGVLLSTSGVLSGTPTAFGTFNFTVTGTDTFGCTGNRAYSASISCPAITIAPSILPDGISASLYDQSITASGGTSPYTYAITSGALPASLTLSSAGVLSGMLRATGTFNFTVTATDSHGCTGNRAYALRDTCPTITLSPSTLPDGTTDSTYNLALFASGGISPYTFAVTLGSLPAGLSLSASGTISGIPTTAESVSVTITGTDSIGCTGSKTYSVKIDSVPEVSLVVPISANWNMLSNPLFTVSDSVRYLFPGALGSAFSYDPNTGYTQADTIANGTGYWLRFNSATNAKMIGMAIDRDTLDVTSGWNMIGSISIPLSANTLTSIGTHLLSSLYGFNGGYQKSDTVRPGGAYWAKFDSAGKFVLSPGPVFARTMSASYSQDEVRSLNNLRFVDAHGNSQTLYFGIQGNSSTEAYSLPPVPPAGIFDVRFASQRMAEVYPSATQSVRQYKINVTGANAPIDIHWSITSTDREGFQLNAIADGKVVNAVKLTSSGSVRITDPNVLLFTLTIRGAMQMPTAYALQQNYPNPFNPTTSIPFTLSQTSEVTLIVYNVIGQEVARVVNRQLMEAGMQEAMFDASALTSGVYFYRLIAKPTAESRQTFMSVRKMILLR